MIDMLPEPYRVVQIMRDIERMSVAETAETLGISQENVKVRLHRARGLLRKRLYGLFGSKVSDLFRFHLLRCDRVVQRVSRRILHDLNTTSSVRAVDSEGGLVDQ
jgi:RNA polymerase sigma-70 factor (ECF subfamily)